MFFLEKEQEVISLKKTNKRFLTPKNRWVVFHF